MSRRAVLIALCACAFAADLSAQISDAVPYAQRPVKEGDWEFSLTPYLWFPSGASGDVVTTAPAISFADDASFFDQIGVSPNVRFEVRGAPWTFMFEGRYLNQDLDGFVGGNAATAEFEAVSGEIAAGFEVYSWNSAGAKGTWDVFAGGRAWSADMDVLVGGGGANIDSEWLDVMVGTRARCQIDADWSVAAGVEFGGFGLAESNELTWEAYLAVGYRVADNIDLELGWRFLGIDREENGLDYDAFFHGPQIGATIRF